MIKGVFFDAVGTLIHLQGTVGSHYALVSERVGLSLEAGALDRAFAECWAHVSARPAIDGPRENDDKDWWRAFVDEMIDHAAPRMNELDRDAFFEVAYSHFAEAGVWELYPDVVDVLATLQGKFHLAVVSNFDGRLRMIFEHLGISKFFDCVFLSSEIGADKPDPLIFSRALELTGLRPNEILHIGDDPVRDWQAARAAGLTTFQLDRQQNSLRDSLQMLPM